MYRGGGWARVVVLAGILLGARCLVATALAQDAVPAAAATDPAASLRARARASFDAGRAHYRAGRFAEAARAFRAALALVPSAELWFNLGRAREELGDYALAADCYRRYLRDSGMQAADSDAVRQRIARLEALAEAARADRRARAVEGVLLLDAGGVHPEVSIDGQPVPDSQAQPWWLPAGKHRLEVREGARAPFISDVEVYAGGLTVARVPQRDPIAAPPEANTRPDVWVWSLAAVSAVALVAGGSAAYVAVDRRRSGDPEAAHDWRIASDGSLVTAGAAALGACIAAIMADR